MFSIKELKKLQKKLSRLYEEGVLRIDPSDPEVHLTIKAIKELNLPLTVGIFEEFGEYPYKVFAIVDGLKLFTICTEQDFKKHFSELKVEEELT